jgi:3-oxoacyl-[acyl-carrier-protein] synthase II
MKRRRVKITGIGPVTPAGIGKDEFWRGILEPVSRVGPVTRFYEDAGAFVGAEVQSFKLHDHVTEIPEKRMPRHTQFALAAASLAAKDAGFKLKDLRGTKAVVLVGASLMDFGTINKTVEMIVRKGPVMGLPSSVFSASVSSIAGTVSELIGGTTRTMAYQSACCSGLDAIGHGAAMVAQGETEIAVCGGTESPLYFHPMLELKMAGLAPGNSDWPQRQCRPFDLWRTTGVIGEGACVMVLEPESSPRPGYAFIDGYAFATDATEQPGEGMVDAMRFAIANAGYRIDDIDCINAWGPGHRIVDASEAGAITRLMDERVSDVPVFSIKGAIGNPLGAAGAIQIACSALCLYHGRLPPTVNWKFPDPVCALNLSAQSRNLQSEVTLVNAHGLSGTNACLVMSR